MKKINNKISARVDGLFHDAVIMLAEEQGYKYMSEKDKFSENDIENKISAAENEKIFSARFYKTVQKYRNAERHRRRIKYATVVAACFMICVGVTGALYGAFQNGNSLDGSIFVYANEKQYNLDYEHPLILSDLKIESNNDYEAPSVMISGFITGIEDDEIAEMTYSCKSGRLFSTLKTAKNSAKTGKTVSFSYYDGYYKDLKWVGDPDAVFNEAEKSNPDYSKIEPDTLIMEMTMKDGSHRSATFLISYTSDGYVQAEIYK